MNVQQLIGEVARRHNVLVDPTDPVFVTVTLNELLLAEYVETIRTALTEAEKTATAATDRRVEAIRWSAAQLMGDAARQLSDQMKGAGMVLRFQLEGLVAEAISGCRAASAEAARQCRIARWVTAVALTSACVAAALAGSWWFRG